MPMKSTCQGCCIPCTSICMIIDNTQYLSCIWCNKDIINNSARETLEGQCYMYTLNRFHFYLASAKERKILDQDLNQRALILKINKTVPNLTNNPIWVLNYVQNAQISDFRIQPKFHKSFTCHLFSPFRVDPFANVGTLSWPSTIYQLICKSIQLLPSF